MITLLNKTLIEIMIMFTFQAQEFCGNLNVNQLECITEIMECYMDDNRTWCEMYYMEQYDGI